MFKLAWPFTVINSHTFNLYLIKLMIVSFILLTLIIPHCHNLQSPSNLNPSQPAPQVSSSSLIIKTHSYTYSSFTSSIPGIPYPQHIQQSDNPTNLTLTFLFRNLSNESLTPIPLRSISYNKPFLSTCQSVLENIDYFGYETDFPYFRIIVVCGNSTHETMGTLRVYSSGDFDVLYGNIVEKIDRDYRVEGLKIGYVHDGTYNTQRIVYKNYISLNRSKSLSFYNQYLPNKAQPIQIPYQLQLEQSLTLPNISVKSLEMGIGEGGHYTAYLSTNYGLIVTTSGVPNKNLFVVWKPMEKEGERLVGLGKLCWSNVLVLLSQGNSGTYIYYIKLKITTTPKQSIQIQQILKSPSLFQQSIPKSTNCQFFTIGNYVICSISQQGQSNKNWYISWVNQNNVKVLVEKFEVGNEKPVIIEDLCSTSSFYVGKSKYQIRSSTLASNNKKQTPFSTSKNSKNYIIKQLKLPLFQGEIYSYLPLPDNSLLLLTFTPPNNFLMVCQCNSTVCYGKHGFAATSVFQSYITIQPAGAATSKGVYSHIVHVMTRFVGFSGDEISFYGVFGYGKERGLMLRNQNQVGFGVREFGILVSDVRQEPDGYNTTYIGKTTIQKQSFCQIKLTDNTTANPITLVYAYEFSTRNFRQCPIPSTLPNTSPKILFYRIDNTPNSTNSGLVLKFAGFRYNRTFLLEDTLFLPQYANKGYQSACTDTGIIVYSLTSGHIVMYNWWMEIEVELWGKFSELKWTKQLLIVQGDDGITVRWRFGGQVVGEFVGIKLRDIVTNVKASGFINIRTNIYYSFQQGKLDQSEETI